MIQKFVYNMVCEQSATAPMCNVYCALCIKDDLSTQTQTRTSTTHFHTETHTNK